MRPFGPRIVGGPGDACGSAQQPLDLIKKDPREGRDGSGAVGKHAPQPLRHRDHPLPHGHRRNDMIDEVGGRLGHVAAVAGRADAAAFAEEGHDESRAARHADRAGEAEADEPALEIVAELVLDVCRHGPLGGFPPGEPSSRGSPTRSCGAASSRADAARNGGLPRGRHGDGVGFARETL
jgi:hypothetical protein